MNENPYKQAWRETAGLKNIYDRESRLKHRQHLQMKYNPHGKTFVEAFKEQSGRVSIQTGLAIAGGLAIADGPLPFGDMAAAGALVGYGLWALFSD